MLIYCTIPLFSAQGHMTIIYRVWWSTWSPAQSFTQPIRRIRQKRAKGCFNAFMYDGASATAEAAMMALRITKRKEILVSRALHPNYRMVLKTYLQGIGIPIKEITFLPVGQTCKDGITDADALSSFISDNTAAVIIQQP